MDRRDKLWLLDENTRKRNFEKQNVAKRQIRALEECAKSLQEQHIKITTGEDSVFRFVSESLASGPAAGDARVIERSWRLWDERFGIYTVDYPVTMPDVITALGLEGFLPWARRPPASKGARIPRDRRVAGEITWAEIAECSPDNCIAAGNVLVLLDTLQAGLQLARDREIRAPDWLLLGAMRTLVELLKGPTRKKTNNSIAKWMSRTSHAMRVRELLAVEKEHGESILASRSARAGDAKGWESSWGRRLGPYRDLVSARLANGPWSGSPEALKDSVQVIRENPALLTVVMAPSAWLLDQLGRRGQDPSVAA